MSTKYSLSEKISHYKKIVEQETSKKSPNKWKLTYARAFLRGASEEPRNGVLVDPDGYSGVTRENYADVVIDTRGYNAGRRSAYFDWKDKIHNTKK